MDRLDAIVLQRTAARAALDKGNIKYSQYQQIIRDLNDREESLHYQNKLRSYKMDEAKNTILKKRQLMV